MAAPYAQYVTGRDPVAVMTDTIVRTRKVVSSLDAAALERPWAPGKWTKREILIHLAHAEIVFGTRLRFALTTDNYVVQPFDQDTWLALDRNGLDGNAALALFSLARAFNLGVTRTLSSADRARAFTHPEAGAMTVEDILVMLAGHELHHLPQLESGAGG